jgi:predicted ATPase
LRLISKRAERNHYIIGGPGTGQSTLIDGLTSKGFVVILKSREVTLEAKKQGIEHFLKTPAFLANFY